MNERALGFVETRGLVGAIEAADAMLKAAKVQLIGKQLTTGGMLIIKVVGEVAAVTAAVEAGAKAAQKVGELVSSHVIPRPDTQTEPIVYEGAEPSLTHDTPGMVSRRREVALEDLTVRELRQLARQTPGFPLQGRQISKANKASLLKELRARRK